MTAQEAEAPQISASPRKDVFFRQSAWLMFATIASGGLMWFVHFLSKKIPDAEYGTTVTLMTSALLIPAMPLQMVFAQQTSAALATGRARELAGMIRMTWAGTFVLWLIGVLVVFALQGEIINRWEIANPAALWVTMLVILTATWTPLFLGVLQGKQDFPAFGWAVILNGVGRIMAAAFIVLVLGGYAAGIMTGVLLGYAVALILGIWQTRQLWLGPAAPFDRGALLRQVVPLLLGFAAYQFLFSADTMFVNAYLGREQTASYGAAGTLSRALVWLVGPLTAVMFPKIVHSVARSEKTNLLAVTLLSTALLVALGAFGLWLVGPLVVKFVYKSSYVAPTLTVLPWYAGAMVPLCMANVLVNNLLARGDFRVVPWLLALAAGYALALTRFHDSAVMVLQTLGVFCCFLFVLCGWFTWVRNGRKPATGP